MFVKCQAADQLAHHRLSHTRRVGANRLPALRKLAEKTAEEDWSGGR